MNTDNLTFIVESGVELEQADMFLDLKLYHLPKISHQVTTSVFG